jgi:hypothetical protein
MRQPVDAALVDEFFRSLGRSAEGDVRVYVTGGATAVLEGWRATTKDIDVKIVPDDDALLRSIPELKERLQINVELASPDDFIPPLPGWEARSRFIRQEGRASFFHYDFYAQALAKLERAHDRDLADVRAMRDLGLIDGGKLRTLFERIEPALYRYPAIQPGAFRKQVEEFLAHASK